MKKSNNNKIKLGIFVTLGAILLILGIYFIGQKQQLFSSTFRVRTIFGDISGLQVGNNVRFSGINVGVVENIELVADTAVRVDLIIDDDVRKFIKKDAKAVIGSDGLMGNKIIIIMPGTSDKPQIANNDLIATSASVSFDDIMQSLKVTADNAAVITDELATIMDNISSGRGTIGKLFMDSAFAQDIDKTLINIKQGAGGFKRNMEAASHNFLLRGYFKKKEKEKEKKKEESKDKAKEQEQKK